MTCWKNRYWIVESLNEKMFLIEHKNGFRWALNLPWNTPYKTNSLKKARRHAIERKGVVKSYQGFLDNRT